MMYKDVGKRWVMGVDVGGSHISASIVDIETGETHPESLFNSRVDSSLGPEEIIDAWHDVMESSMDTVGFHVDRIGIAMPGPFDYRNGVSLMQGLGKYDRLHGFHVKSALAERLSIEQGNIRMENDATSFLRGERKIGSARGCHCVVGITLGTGLGSCVYQNGVMEEGDLWNLPFRGGVAEDVISSRWILSQYESMVGSPVSNVREILEKSGADTRVVGIFEELGRSLGSVVSLRYGSLMPERIVFTGGLTKCWHLYAGALSSVLADCGFKAGLEVSTHQELSAMVGAAMLWSSDESM